MKLTTYTIETEIPRSMKIILASDLHDKRTDDSIGIIEKIKPDLILCPGDMTEEADENAVSDRNGFLFMKKAAELAPLFYSLGNHEHGMSAENRALLQNAGIRLLDDSFVTHDGIHIGGLTSGFVRSIRQRGYYAPWEPNLAFLHAFSALDGFKLLLCHHPEYFEPYLRPTSVHVILSGHAHGGQWRLRSQGILAPGQGLLPKYTAGVHENRLCISCGMANTVPIPRFFNPRELVLLELLPKQGTNE